MTEAGEVHVLLIEDDSIDAKAVERAFKRAQINNPVTRAKDGVEGLLKLRGEAGAPGIAKPYLILLDLNMPRMSGLEFLSELRRDPEHHDAVVFVLTTSKAEEDRVASYERNVAGYMVKSEVGKGFSNMTALLDRYWNVVQLPS